MVKIFENAGYEALGAYSGEQAREILQMWAPDLAIVDVRLPQMSGIDLAVLLRAEHPECRLTLFSGQAETADLLERAIKEGHTFEIIAKPVHPTELLNWAAASSLPQGEGR